MSSNRMLPSELLPHLMGVFDELEKSPALSDQLTQSTMATRQAQGLTYSDEAIENAVERQLAPCADTDVSAQFSFGWVRPSSETKRQALLTRYPMAFKLVKGPNRWNYVAGVTGCLMSGGLTWLTTSSMAVSVSVLFFGLLILPPASDVAARFFLKRRGAIQVMDAELTLALLQKWASFPKARAYVRACLDSPVPTILSQDRVIVDAMIEQHRVDCREEKEKEVEATMKENLNRLFHEGAGAA